MTHDRAKMTKTFMVRASYHAKDIVDAHLKLMGDTINDSRRAERLKKHECKACFYIRGKLGGAAMTHRACGICGEDQLYSNTNTDVLCRDCAVKHNLCKHCGGDLDMRPKRRKWPSVAELQ